VSKAGHFWGGVHGPLWEASVQAISKSAGVPKPLKWSSLKNLVGGPKKKKGKMILLGALKRKSFPLGPFPKEGYHFARYSFFKFPVDLTKRVNPHGDGRDFNFAVHLHPRTKFV